MFNSKKYRQLEQDKEDAMVQLQERNKEWLKEREDKKDLEEKIKHLESKIVVGGKHPQQYTSDDSQDTEYQNRFNELEKERQA